MKTRIIAVLLAFTFLSRGFIANSYAGDPPPLPKADAAKIITSMGYQNVNIGAIVQGFGMHLGPMVMPFSTSSACHVLGYAVREGKPQKIERDLFYDKDIGWFYFEMDEEKNRMRLWATTDYSEIKPLGQK